MSNVSHCLQRQGIFVSGQMSLKHACCMAIPGSQQRICSTPLMAMQAFLPLLGATQPPVEMPGRIINMSSISGKYSAPFVGAYCASKHALEGMSDSLRRELMLFGIDVIVIGKEDGSAHHVQVEADLAD